MSAQSPRSALLENRPWYRNLRALLAIVGTIGAGIIYMAGGFDSAKKYVEHVLWNWPEEGVEIVLDSSDAMNDLFAGEAKETKFDAALGILKDAGTLSLKGDVSLAFRQFGAKNCDENVSHLAAGFGSATTSRISSLLPMHPAGEKASLSLAVAKAVSDFEGDRFIGQPKRIIVIWGGSVDCWSDSSRSIEYIKKMLEQKQFTADLRFIGMGLSPEQRQALKDLAEKTGGKFYPVDNRPELSRVFKQVMVDEPVNDAVAAVLNTLNSYVADVESFVDSINHADYALAAQKLASATVDIRKIDRAIDGLAFQADPKLHDLYANLVKVRAVQRSLRDTSQAILEAAKSKNEQMFKERAGDYEKYKQEFNNTTREISKSLHERTKDIVSG